MSKSDKSRRSSRQSHHSGKHRYQRDSERARHTPAVSRPAAEAFADTETELVYLCPVPQSNRTIASEVSASNRDPNNWLDRSEKASPSETDSETASDKPAAMASDNSVKLVYLNLDDPDSGDNNAHPAENSDAAETKAKARPVIRSIAIEEPVVEVINDEPAEVESSDSNRDHRKAGGNHGRSKKPEKKNRVGKALLIAVSILLVLILCVVSVFFVLKEIGRRSLHGDGSLEIITPTADESGNSVISADRYGRIINYNGTSYIYNDDIIALTLIGIDNGSGKDADLYMADSIYIFTIDVVTGKTKILGISRDTMADVDVYSNDGVYIDSELLQIAYSYCYHGQDSTGGENTNKSISRIFFGLPVENYFVINLEALTDLNDAVGGVTLTSSMTFVSPEDGRTISEGDTVTLHGKESEMYIRYRDKDRVDANSLRMERQKEYIRAFLSTVFKVVKSDFSAVTELYGTIKANSNSSLNLPELTYIVSTALSKMDSVNEIEYINLEGQMTMGSVNAEMHVSDEQALRTMLDVFYKPTSTVPAEKATPSAPLESAPAASAPVTAESTAAEAATVAVQEPASAVSSETAGG